MKGAFHFIVNPAAGGGRAARVWPGIQERLSAARVDFEWSTTRGPGEAQEIAARIAEGVTAVVVGGDGTLSELLAGLPAGRAVGLIPAGRGNDFARSARISLDPLVALRQLLQGKAFPFDLPLVNGRPFVNVAGVGFDALVARKAETARGAGTLPYLSAALRSLARYRPRHLVIDVDGRQSEGKVFLLAVGNGRYYAGGMKICPAADFDDGLLDLCLAGDLGHAEALLALARVFRGTHIRQRKFHYIKAHTIRVDGPDDVLVHADGQVIGSLPATFTLRQRALKVIVPPGAWTPSKVTSIHHRVSAGKSLGSSP